MGLYEAGKPEAAASLDAFRSAMELRKAYLCFYYFEVVLQVSIDGAELAARNKALEREKAALQGTQLSLNLYLLSPL